jgi:hypothetical protein
MLYVTGSGNGVEVMQFSKYRLMVSSHLYRGDLKIKGMKVQGQDSHK